MKDKNDKIEICEKHNCDIRKCDECFQPNKFQDQTNNRIREELIRDFNRMWHTADFRKPEKMIKESISKWWLLKIDELLKSQKEEKKCEHNMIPYTFIGAWGGSVPPPNMKCTKCLLETRF